MINLNECKFGDKLKMRNGKLALYIGKAHHHIIAIDGEIKEGKALVSFYDDYGVCRCRNNKELDIIGRWEGEK